MQHLEEDEEATFLSLTDHLYLIQERFFTFKNGVLEQFPKLLREEMHNILNQQTVISKDNL